MSNLLESAKKFSVSNARQMKDLSGRPELFRTACMCFRDPVDSPSDQHSYHDFTENIDEIQSFLHTQSATGGGDNPEDWAGALEIVLDKFSWRNSSKQIVLLVTDAPAHGLGDPSLDSHYDKERPRILAILQRFAEHNVRLGLMDTQAHTNPTATSTSMEEASRIYSNMTKMPCPVRTANVENASSAEEIQRILAEDIVSVCSMKPWKRNQPIHHHTLLYHREKYCSSLSPRQYLLFLLPFV